jgi:hypothetical protein
MICLLRFCNTAFYSFRYGRLHLAAILLAFLSSLVAAQGLDETAIITALQGSVGIVSAQGAQPLQPFTRLKQGDSLMLDGSTALLKLIYFKSGRQEIWHGNGRVEILENQGRGEGLSAPETSILARQVVKQIAKTPTDSRIWKGDTRLRSLGGGASVEQIEESYRRMRMEAVRGDLNPELYLLSALFEMREIERVEQVLADLRVSRPTDQEARVVIALYQKAVRNFKEVGGR